MTSNRSHIALNPAARFTICGPYAALVARAEEESPELIRVTGHGTRETRRSAEVRLGATDVSVRLLVPGAPAEEVAVLPVGIGTDGAEKGMHLGALFAALTVGPPRRRSASDEGVSALLDEAHETLAFDGSDRRAIVSLLERMIPRLQVAVASARTPAHGAVVPELVDWAAIAETQYGSTWREDLLWQCVASPAVEELLSAVYDLQLRRRGIELRLKLPWEFDDHRRLPEYLWTAKRRR